MACPRDWIDVLQALLTPTIAIAGAFVAYRQWVLNNAVHRREMFSKRFAVFKGASEFISATLSKGCSSSEEQIRFLTETEPALFLYDQSMADYMRKIWVNCANYQTLVSVMPTMQQGEELEAAKANHKELSDWLYGESKSMATRFEKYLRI